MVKWIYRRFIWIQGIHAICWISGSISFTIEILVFQNEIHTYFCQKLDTFKLWHVRICSSRFLWDFLLVNFLFYTARFRFSSSDLLKKTRTAFPVLFLSGSLGPRSVLSGSEQFLEWNCGNVSFSLKYI